MPARVGGDAHRLRQILINLLSNSVKFTERGSIGVEVDIVTESASEVTLRFQVRDIGIGISAQVLRRLFQPFSPGDSSARRRYSGTGLGLAISKRLVELMGGDSGDPSDRGRNWPADTDRCHDRERNVSRSRIVFRSRDGRLSE